MDKQLLALFCEVDRELFQYYAGGENYNIFRELNLAYNEVRHSLLLASLINPIGMHGCQGRLYSAFLDNIGIDTNWLGESQNTNIYTEYFIGKRNTNIENDENYGRIDILIENGSRALIIENKINAPDQPLQLKRYSDFGIKKYGKDNFKIIYLTPDIERDPKECSILGINDIGICHISYKEEILNWLKQIVNYAEISPSVKAVILQYIEVIEEITNSSEQSLLYQNIIGKLLSGKYQGLTPNDIITFRDSARNRFFRALHTELKKELPDCAITFVQSIHNETEDIESLLTPTKHPKNIGIKIGKKDRMDFFIEIQNWTRLIYGLFNPDRQCEIYEKMLSLGYKQEVWWLLKEYKLRNSEGFEFPFYSDFLNNTFYDNYSEMAKKFGDIIINDYKNAIL